jgi:hypothetical protein
MPAKKKPTSPIPYGTCVMKSAKGRDVIVEQISVPHEIKKNGWRVNLEKVRARIITRKGKTKEVDGFYFRPDSILKFVQNAR